MMIRAGLAAAMLALLGSGPRAVADPKPQLQAIEISRHAEICAGKCPDLIMRVDPRGSVAVYYFAPEKAPRHQISPERIAAFQRVLSELRTKTLGGRCTATVVNDVSLHVRWQWVGREEMLVVCPTDQGARAIIYKAIEKLGVPFEARYPIQGR